jgi:transposase
MVQKLCTPPKPSALQLSKEVDIPSSTLLRWVHELGGRKMENRTAEDWSPEERLEAVVKARSLSDDDLGEFLRSQGLFSQDIANWKKDAISGMSSKRKPGRPKHDPDLVAAKEIIKALEKNLRRKDKALAEQTALLILQKKVQEIWGRAEEDV